MPSYDDIPNSVITIGLLLISDFNKFTQSAATHVETTQSEHSPDAACVLCQLQM